MFETTNQLWLINAKICRASWVLLSLLNSRTWQLQVQNEHHDVHDENPCICKWTKNPWVTQLHRVSATSTALWEPFKPFIPRSFLFFFSEINHEQSGIIFPPSSSVHSFISSFSSYWGSSSHDLPYVSAWKKCWKIKKIKSHGGTPINGGHSTPIKIWMASFWGKSSIKTLWMIWDPHF